MDSPSILAALKNQLGPQTIQQMSEQLGTDPAATSNAVAMALPLLLGGLNRNASDPRGAAALNNALDAHDGGILDNLGDLLRNPAAGAGGAILGHILGSKKAPVEQGVGRATGLSAQQISTLLAMLAPLVMGVLGRMKRERGLDANRLPEVLGQAQADMQRESPSAGGLGSILDSNNDGQIADDLMRMGSSVLGGLFGSRR